MKNRKQIGGLLLSIGLFAASVAAFAQSTDAKQGQALWDSKGCYLCHGTVGQGGFGPAVAVDLVPFVALSTYVRHPTGDMPPFSANVVSDTELHDIYAYLQSVPQPKSPDSIPLLKSAGRDGAK